MNNLSYKLILILLLALLFITGCGKQISEDSHKKKITVTTSFLRDIVEKLAGDAVIINEIIPAGEDPHLYVAKPNDLLKLKNTDLILYHGLHFEGKLQKALEKNGFAVSSTFDKYKIDELEEDGEKILDPHFWFDIDLYKEAVHNTALALIKTDPQLKELIEKNEAKYQKELDLLAINSKEKIATIPPNSRYLVTPHDAFNYFARYFDIKVISPQGINSESEVSNKDLQDTIDFVIKHRIKSIFVESTTDPARMQKIKEAAANKGYMVNVISGENKELFSDSLAPKGHDGDTYIKMMEHNIDLIVNNLK